MDKQLETDIATESELSVWEFKDVMDELEVMYRYEMIDQPLKKQINVVCWKKIRKYYSIVQCSRAKYIDKPTNGQKVPWGIPQWCAYIYQENYFNLASARRRTSVKQLSVQSKS